MILTICTAQLENLAGNYIRWFARIATEHKKPPIFLTCMLMTIDGQSDKFSGYMYMAGLRTLRLLFKTGINFNEF